MNILPIVTGFALLFSIGTYALLHSLRNSFDETVRTTSAFKMERDLANLFTLQVYNEYKGDNLHPQRRNKRQRKKETVFLSRRMKPVLWNESKLNLSFLLKPGQEKLEAITINLLKRLYQFAPFYKEGLEKRLYTEMIQILSEQKEKIGSIEDIWHFVQEEKEVFYHILKGTQNYQIGTSIGYPPLGEFFTLNSDGKVPIHFAWASYPLLQAIFGEIIPPQIIEEEKKKWEEKRKHTPLRMYEIDSLVQKHNLKLSDYKSLMDFSFDRKKAPKHFVEDEKTNMKVRVKKR